MVWAFGRLEPETVEKRREREREILIGGGDGVLVVLAREKERLGERDTNVEKEK